MKKYIPKDFDLPEVPGISSKTMTMHLGLYAGYVSNLNAHYEALQTECDEHGDSTVFRAALTRRINFELAGVTNHEHYFGALVGGAQACPEDSRFYREIVKQFKTMENFVEAVRTAATTMRGIGWAFVAYDKTAAAFHILWVRDHELGNVNLPIVLAIDMWEHSYLVDYAPAKKGEYVDSYLRAVNWNSIAQSFDKI